MSLENDLKVLLNLSEKDMGADKSRFIEFGDFRIDLTERELLKNGEPIPLTIKAFDVLTYLAENPGHTVTKDELMKAVWPDSFVEEANITRIVHTLRKTLGDDEGEHQFIRTMPKRGYRFVAEVKRPPLSDAEAWPATIEETEPERTRSTGGRPVPYVLIGSAIGVLVIAVAAIAFTTRTELKVEPAVKRISIAVLPFRPIGSDKSDPDHDLAFANELILGLSQSKDLQVRPFSTMRRYTDVTQDPLAIGIERGADYVLETTYLTPDGVLDVTASLFDVRTGTVAATVKFLGSGRDLYAARRDVASKIVPDLLAKLNLETVVPVYRNTENEEAWRSYVHGMVLSNKRSVEDAQKAIPEFERAISLDPTFAQGHMGLAHALATILVNGGDPNEYCGPSRQVNEKALELDPASGDALAGVAAVIRMCQWLVKEGEEKFARAVKLSPNSAHVRRFYAVHMMNEGRFDEALEHLRIARELDPNSTFNEKLVGRVLFFARRYDDAIAQSIKTKDLDPEVEQTSFVFMAYELKDEQDKAFEWFLVVRSLDGEGEADLNAWRATFAESGWPGVLRRRLDRALEAERTENGINKRARLLEEITTLSVQLGELDRAFDYMEKAADRYHLFAAQLLVNPYLDPIRSDPRYKAILGRTWNKNGGSYHSVF